MSDVDEVPVMRVFLLVSLPIVVSCAAAPPPASASAGPAKLPAVVASHGQDASPEPGASPEPKSDASEPPERAMAEADGIYRDQLAVPGRDERFSTDRQVAALERAIALYEQFLERAGDDPRYGEAARRSRGRIADARETIAFLKAQGSER